MKSPLLLLAFFVIVFISRAQTFKVNAGKIIGREELNEASIGVKNFMRQEMGRRSKGNYFVDSRNKILYIGLAGDEDKQYRFGVLKDYVNLVDTKKMTLEMPGLDGVMYRILRMIDLNGKRFVFYETGGKENRVLYVNQMDDNFVLLGSAIKLMDLKEVAGSTSIHVSEDKKSILILRALLGEADKKVPGSENGQLICTLLDDQFSQVWQTEYKMPFRFVRDGDIAQAEIDNDRNMYLLTYNTTKGFSANLLKATLYQYYWQTKTWKSTPLGDPEAKTWGVDFELLKGTTPVIAGITGSNRKMTYFATVIDPISQTGKQITNKALPEEYKTKDRYFSPDYFGVSNIVMTDNGNITVSIEGAVKYIKGSAVIYLFSPTYVAQLDASGRDVWQRIIHQKQILNWVPNSGGHGLFTKGNDVIVLYNDNSSNAKRTIDDKKVKFYKRNGTVLFAQTITPSGKASRELIVPTGIDMNYSIDPRYMLPIGDKVFLTEAWNLDGGAKSWSYAYATVELK